MFSFRNRSLVTVHRFAQSYSFWMICTSRPLQWRLTYLSRLSGCPKSSQSGAPSSGISLLGTKSNHQVLNLANTEGGQSQSLFVGPNLLVDCCVVGRGIVMQKEAVTRFTYAQSRMLNSVLEPFHYTFVVHCIDSFTLRNKFFVDYSLPIEENHQHGLHTRLLKLQFFRPWQGFSDPCSGLMFSGRVIGKTLRLITLQFS